MDKFKEQLNKCGRAVDDVRNKINIQGIPSQNINYAPLYQELYALIPLIPDDYSEFRNRLRDNILLNLKLQDVNFVGQYGIPLTAPRNGINPYALGEVIATITYLMELTNRKQCHTLWDTMHPEIMSVSRKLFDDGHYANAVEDAFKEVNSRVKKIYKERTGTEKDGHKLMQPAFSVQNPIIKLDDTSTESGINIQQGFMEMFAGAILAFRNPQAHANQKISKEEAIRGLNFASLLMFKIDNEIKE